MIDRRKFIQAGIAAGLASSVPFRWAVQDAYGAPAMLGLSDPALQPKFATIVPDALSPGFRYMPDKFGRYRVQIREAIQQTGLRANGTGPLLNTPVWGYADQMDNKKAATWPGKTFEVKSVSAGGLPETEVSWANSLKNTPQHLLPIDTSLHWCYALNGYQGNTIATAGVPIITHLHGGHSDFQFDGNPEFFYSPGNGVIGPQWNNVPGGFTTKFRYDNNVQAGNLWYHDHALGITRMNVYAGLAGFYFVRDEFDTGQPDNPLGLPAPPYEKAYAIQDRMFRDTGELFYSSLPGDPFYADFIAPEVQALLPDPTGLSALAEFFGDHMVVNGVIWPYEPVEPRNYRMHLLNGTDSRFMVIRFRAAAAPDSTDLIGASAPIPFYVIGSDQGLASEATWTDTLVFEPGSRYDIVFDFKGLQGKRIIMENIGGDSPFGGDYGNALTDEDVFPDRQTDRVMAFDVIDTTNVADSFDPSMISNNIINPNTATRTRKVALFEGTDELGRLQPLLGTAEPTMNAAGVMVNGSIAWHEPTTENPGVGDTEIWEIYNATGDAHPVHLHLVNFQILDREGFTATSVSQPVLQHNGTYGQGFTLENIALDGNVEEASSMLGYVENAPKDMVTALPDTVTRIKATFDKPGRYVWHCHILSHEDHEMMRVLHVGPGA